MDKEVDAKHISEKKLCGQTRVSGWNLAVPDQYSPLFIKFDTPIEVPGKSDLAVAEALANKPYPTGRQYTEIVETAPLQIAIYSDLHAKLHGARGQEAYLETLAAGRDTVAITTIPAACPTCSTRDTYVNNQQRQILEWWDEEFPGIDLIETLGCMATTTLMHSDTDGLREVLKINLGYKAIDWEQYSRRHHSDTFPKPKLHDAHAKVPDSEVRNRISMMGRFLQKVAMKAFPGENLFGDRERSENFAKVFSLQLSNEVGLEWEGCTINNAVMPRSDLKEGEVVEFVVEKGHNVQLVVGGVLDHVDRFNCTREGYNKLAGLSAILHHEEQDITMRVQALFYMRTSVTHSLERDTKRWEVLQTANDYLATVSCLTLPEIEWSGLVQAGEEYVAGDGLQFAKVKAGHDRMRYLQVFGSIINDLAIKFSLNGHERASLVSLAMLLNGNWAFYVIGSQWLEQERNPFGSDGVLLPYVFIEDCRMHATIRSATNNPHGSARFCPFTGSFWKGLESAVATERVWALKVWNDRVEAIEKIVIALESIRGKCLPDMSDRDIAGQVHRAIVHGITGDTKLKPDEKKKEFQLPGEVKQYRVPESGSLTGWMYLPMLIVTGLVGEEYIPAARYNQIREESTYAKVLQEMGFTTVKQREALVEFLVEHLGKERDIIENVLCKLYRKKEVYDYYWLGMTMYEFVENRLVKRVLEDFDV